MKQLPHTIVIATYERGEEMKLALDSVVTSTRQPEAVIVVDSSRSTGVREVVESFADKLPVSWHAGEIASAAGQRNQGTRMVTTPLVVFMDDDSILRPDTLELMLAAFDEDAEERIGGIAARMEGFQHSPPKGLLWWYYRIQAGYSHPDYGGKCFAPGINCLPTYAEGSPVLIPGDWLPSTCLAYRTSTFLEHKFPAFEGYSFMEDVHVSSRVKKTHDLYFHRDAYFVHLDAGSEFKRDRRGLAASRIRHQYAFARDVLGCSGLFFEVKFFLHRVFATVAIFRSGNRQKREEIQGTWASVRQDG